MTELINILSNIPKDCLLHFFYGVIIYRLAKFTMFSPVTILVLFAFSKEFYDSTFSPVDILWTLLPVLIFRGLK